MDDRRDYNKLAGGAGTHGADYQMEILLLFLLEGYQRNEKFRLSTENKLGGKFDDVIYETKERSILLQAKHKENPKDKKQQIAFNDIFPSTGNKDEFNLFKYMESFSMITPNFNNIERIVICTNVNVTKDKSSVMNDCVFPKPIDNGNIFSCCDQTSYSLTENCKQYFLKNVKCVSEKSVDEFVKRFQLVIISDENIGKRISKIVEKIYLVTDLGNNESLINFLRNKVKEWFKGKKGVYLTFQDLETYLIYFRSQYFINRLQQLNIEFQPIEYVFQKYKCCVIQDKKFVELHIMKIYQHLKKNKVLIVNPQDPISIQIKTVASFKSDGIISIIIPLFKMTYESLKEIIQSVTIETFSKSYKNIMFITDEIEISNQLTTDIQIKFNAEKTTIVYDNLSKATQSNLFQKQVNFQGKVVPFCNILPADTEQLNSILDESTFYLLLTGTQLTINGQYKEITLDYYVERSFQYVRNTLLQDSNEESMYSKQMLPIRTEQKIITEKELYEHVICKSMRKVILLSDGPGMGKSTSLSRLQQLLKEENMFWIIRINLNECTDIFCECVRRNEINLSLETLTKPFASNFEKEIFKCPERAILLFDGFDEISPHYGFIVLNLIGSCINQENIMKIVLTTRPHCQKEIESVIIDADVYKLQQFQQTDQNNFLYNYWTKELKLTKDIDRAMCKEYVEKVTLQLSNTVGNNLSGLIGIPLQCKMIAEIFADYCSQYIESGTINTLKQINITDMYQMFIEKKKSILLDEKFSVKGNVEVQEEMNKKIDNAIKQHVKIAIELLFNKDQHQYFSMFGIGLHIPIEFLLRLGILEESNKSLIFIHKTFAEFLVATYICDRLCEHKVKKGFLDFLIQQIILGCRYDSLLLFMDTLLENKKIPKYILQVCSKNIKKFPEIIDVLTTFGHYNLVRLILEECYYCYHCNNFVPTSLKLSHLFFWKKSTGPKLNLHLACKGGWNKLVNFFIQKGLDINAQDFCGRTPLHMGVTTDERDILQMLIQGGADINSRDHYGYTPFLLACRSCSVRCVKYLIDHKTEVCFIDELGRNGLHYIVRLNPTNSEEIQTMEEIVKYIIDKSLHFSSVDDEDDEGNTPLHYAAEANSVWGVNTLINYDAKINKKNRFGESPLHKAASVDALEVVNILKEAGAIVDERHMKDCTTYFKSYRSHSNRHFNYWSKDSKYNVHVDHYNGLHVRGNDIEQAYSTRGKRLF